MTDYSKLADLAKQKDIVDRKTIEEHKKLRSDHCSFFTGVTNHLAEEMKKANVELRKRRAPILEQISVPSFGDEILLTYGTDSLCRVGRGIIKGECRITAVISGPPNGFEISRRVYHCKQEETCREVITIEAAEAKTATFVPAEVAADIIYGVLLGKFQ